MVEKDKIRGLIEGRQDLERAERWQKRANDEDSAQYRVARSNRRALLFFRNLGILVRLRRIQVFHHLSAEQTKGVSWRLVDFR